MEKLRVVPFSPGKYINLAPSSAFISEVPMRFFLPLTNYYLTQTQLNKILCHRF